MSRQVAELISKLYIARSDVKAIQRRLPDGKVIYTPHLTAPDKNGERQRIKWRRSDLESHLSGTQTFGHYALSAESQAKLFTLDIDLATRGLIPESIDPEAQLTVCEDLRGEWRNRKSEARTYLKREFRLIAHKLMKVIYEDLELPCAAAYSGSKGIHVYGFTGLISGYDTREAARITLETVSNFTVGINGIYRSPEYPNFEIEIYPKQDTIDAESDGLGNLVRLPLGRNIKTTDPTFFIDMTLALNELKAVDPVWALTDGAVSPWRKPNE